MENIKAEAKVGLIVLVSLSIVIFTIVWGKNYKLTKTYHPYTISFPNVMGLEKGARVLIHGLTMGSVRDFHLRSDGVLADIMVIKDIEIYDDASAYIESPGFVDEKVVVLMPGVSGKTLPVGSTMKGTAPPTFSEVLNDVSSLSENVGSALDEITQVSQNLNSFIDDPALMGSVTKTLNNLASASRNLNNLISHGKPQVDSTLSNMTRISTKASNMMDKYESGIDTIFTNLVILSADLHNVTATIKDFSDIIHNENSSLGKIISKDDLYNDLRRVTANLDSMITEFRKNGVKTKLSIF